MTYIENPLLCVVFYIIHGDDGDTCHNYIYKLVEARKLERSFTYKIQK